MENEFLKKIRKLNWVLSESTTGSLSYEDLSRILSEMIDANIYIFDTSGRILGVCYNYAGDTSTEIDEVGEKIPDEHNRNFLLAQETIANLKGERLNSFFEDSYPFKDKYHMVIPSFCGGRRQGTILLAKYKDRFTDEDIALCEYGATVVGLEILRVQQLEKAKERSLRMAVDMAIETLSFSEKDALGKIFECMEEDEGIIIASKVAKEYSLTNSVIVSALKKLESAGLITTKSLGMKGTYIKIVNPYLKESYATI